MKTRIQTSLILMFFLLFISCTKDEIEVIQSEGYIVGFDPCTIRHNYRIGYVIVSEDNKDTLVTYNLSDTTFKIPANILFNLSDTLYKIPESYFENFMNSGYFPTEARYEFKIRISYSLSKEKELVVHECLSDFNNGDFSKQILNNQVVLKSVTKF